MGDVIVKGLQVRGQWELEPLVEGRDSDDGWMIVDCGRVIVHLFEEEVRLLSVSGESSSMVPAKLAVLRQLVCLLVSILPFFFLLGGDSLVHILQAREGFGVEDLWLNNGCEKVRCALFVVVVSSRLCWPACPVETL